MTTDQFALLELLKATLFHIEPHFPTDADWDAVLAEAKSHAVVALAAPSVPATEADKWRTAVDQNTAYWLQLLYAQKALVTLFAENNIPLVILKGTAAAIAYPNPIQRTMGDIDFLVPPDRFDEAQVLMENSGYDVQFGDSNDDGRHIGYTKGGMVFELHRRFSTFGVDIDSEILNGLAHCEKGVVSGTEFPMLPTLHNGLVLLAHIRQHLIEETYSLGLRQVIDWAMYVHAHFHEDSWEPAFTALAKQYQLDTLAATMTAVCNTALGLPDKTAWTADGATVDELLERILSCGNFGAKKTKEAAAFDPLQNAMEQFRQEGFFHYLQHAGEENWKASQRYRILKPFAWLYQLLRYVGKIFAHLFSGKSLTKELSKGKKEIDFKNRIGV